ncbi:hypothetical protein D3C78_838140 [compost metagenome]
MNAQPSISPTKRPAEETASSVSLVKPSGSSRWVKALPMPSTRGANGLKASNTGCRPARIPSNRPEKNALMGSQNLMMAIPAATNRASGPNRAPTAPKSPPKVIPKVVRVSLSMARGPSKAARIRDRPPKAAVTRAMTPAIFIRVLASSGLSFAHWPRRSDRSVTQVVSALISGAMASPTLTMALVKVPVAASQRLPRVPSWALIRSCNEACAAIFRCTSS